MPAGIFLGVLLIMAVVAVISIGVVSYHRSGNGRLRAELRSVRDERNRYFEQLNIARKVLSQISTGMVGNPEVTAQVAIGDMNAKELQA